MRVFLVYNPHARLAGRVGASSLRRELTSLGAEVHLVEATDVSETAQMTHEAVRAGFDRVVAAGGDGTISAVTAGLAHTPVPLAIIPLGTGNVLAEEAGLKPGRWRHACKVALGNSLVRIDVGRAGGRYFAAMFGAGLDAQVVVDIAARHKLNYGRLAFVGQFLQTVFSYAPVEFSIVADGQSLRTRAWTVVVCNTPRYAWRLHFTPSASPADGRLDTCVFGSSSRSALLIQGAMAFVAARVIWAPTLASFRAQHIVIDASPPVPWQADGDVGGTTPVQVEVLPQALTVAVASDACPLAQATASRSQRSG